MKFNMWVGFIIEEVKQAAANAKGKVVDLIGIMSEGFGTVSDFFAKPLSYLAEDSS